MDYTDSYSLAQLPILTFQNFFHSVSCDGPASNLQTRTRINLEIVRQFQKHDVQLVKANPVHTKWDKVELV